MVTVNPAAARQNAAARRPASGSAKPTTPLDRAKPAGASDDLLIVPFTVLYDHRERRGGWRFNGLHADSDNKHRPLAVRTREIHMVTADYTVEGVPVYIERKSHDDAIGSMGGGHANLRLEHERMREIIAAGGHCCVIVESSLERICEELDGEGNERRLTSAGVLGVLSSWPMQFQTPWHFAGSRAIAERLALKILWKAWELNRQAQITKG